MGGRGPGRSTGTNMSDTGWLLIAFAAVAAGIGGYLLSIAARRKKLEGRLRDRGKAE